MQRAYEKKEGKESGLTMNQLEELNLSTKTYKCLKAAGFDYIEELTKRTPTEMGYIRGFGSKAFAEVYNKLTELGLTFKEE